eukprot:1955805-Rhodomonas_salina.2
MLVQLAIKSHRSCLQTLSPTTARSAGQTRPNKADGSDSRLTSACACAGTPPCALTMHHLA